MGSRLEKNSSAVRERIASHTFDDEEGEEYAASKFGGFNDYFRRKKIKLQNRDALLREEAADNPAIFKGVVAHVNGYTQPSLDDIHRLIVLYGGGFIQYLDGKTMATHIIASSLTPKKAVEFKRYRIVNPAWVVDSVKAGKLLPWNEYRVVDEGAGQKLLAFSDDGKVTSKSNNRPSGYREQTDSSWYTSQFKKPQSQIKSESGPTFDPRSRFMSSGNVGDGSITKGKQREQDSHEGGDIPSDEESVTSEDFAVSSSLEEALKTVFPGSQPKKAQILETLQSRTGLMNGQIIETTGFPAFEEVSPHKQQTDLQDSILQQLPQRDEVQEEDAKSQKRKSNGEEPSSKKMKALTAEEHNALLLSDPHIRKSSTANPEFLKVYYSESRLHHLSTWKADLKARLQKMSMERSASQKRATKRQPGARRYILHVDFDSFFCAVSLKKAPEFKDKPAVVAHGTGSGSEIASCNYPAREFGIKNGQWMKSALEACPTLKILPYDFPGYEEASHQFYEAILAIGGVVQSVSVDEALVDVTAICLDVGGSDGVGVNEGSIWREQAKADELATAIRQRVREATGCEVSVGVGGNILLAKLALRKAKPAGQYHLKPEEVLDFIGELTVQNLPGVSYNIGGKLEELGVTYVKDIRSLSKERLMTTMGPKTGEKLWDYSRGIDRTEVGDVVVRKSVSAEVNWGIRFISQTEAEEFVQNLCGELEKRLLEQQVRGRQLTMKIMHRSSDAPLDPPKHLGHGKCDTYNKSVALGVPTNSAEILGKEAISILRSYRFSPGELRGLGVQMTKIEPIKQAGLDNSQKKLTFASPGPKTVTFENDDPISDPNSPRKDRTLQIHPAKAITKSEVEKGATSKLNLMGTQFIVPTQMDSEVLQQLPTDIRSRLLAQGKAKQVDRPSPLRGQSPISRPESPNKQSRNINLPSQLDPEVFESLPEDVKAEVLASYSSHLRTEAPSRGQTVLPQSPHKSRSINALAKKQTTPTKKKGLLSRGRKGTVDSHFKQSSFVQPKPKTEHLEINNVGVAEEAEDEELDPDFLSALPEEMRKEVIADHRRQREIQHGQVGLQMPSRHAPVTAAEDADDQVTRFIYLSPRPEKPSFTTQKLKTLPELRDAITAWHDAFIDEGPLEDDTAALKRYLGKVVTEEKDMNKAVTVAKWLAWVVEESDAQIDSGRTAWLAAVEDVKNAVQHAVRARGLGRVEL